MSDLNQWIRRVKRGVIDAETARARALPSVSKNEFKNIKPDDCAPLCCTYFNGKGMICCSRGCISVKDWEQDKTLYRKKLCRECLEEARKLEVIEK